MEQYIFNQSEKLICLKNNNSKYDRSSAFNSRLLFKATTQVRAPLEFSKKWKSLLSFSKLNYWGGQSTKSLLYLTSLLHTTTSSKSKKEKVTKSFLWVILRSKKIFNVKLLDNSQFSWLSIKFLLTSPFASRLLSDCTSTLFYTKNGAIGTVSLTSSTNSKNKNLLKNCLMFCCTATNTKRVRYYHPLSAVARNMYKYNFFIYLMFLHLFS